MKFDQWQTADRVEIISFHNETLREISSPQAIQALADFALAHKSGWAAPWIGAPSPGVRARFFQADVFLGDLGVGDNYLIAQGCGAFQRRRLSDANRNQAMQLFFGADFPSSPNPGR